MIFFSPLQVPVRPPQVYWLQPVSIETFFQCNSLWQQHKVSVFFPNSSTVLEIYHESFSFPKCFRKESFTSSISLMMMTNWVHCVLFFHDQGLLQKKTTIFKTILDLKEKVKGLLTCQKCKNAAGGQGKL